MEERPYAIMFAHCLRIVFVIGKFVIEKHAGFPIRNSFICFSFVHPIIFVEMLMANATDKFSPESSCVKDFSLGYVEHFSVEVEHDYSL